MPQENEWYLVSSHGAVLMYIALYPNCTIKELAEAMSRTRRTIWGVVGDLRRAGLLHVRKEGRRHHYRVNLEGKFKHPTILKDAPIGLVFGDLVKQYSRSQSQGS